MKMTITPALRLHKGEVKVLPMLVERYQARAGDWESGAIAFVASRSGLPCLILRGVTDLVNEQDGEAYGNIDVFHSNTEEVMLRLLQALPAWLRCFM